MIVRADSQILFFLRIIIKGLWVFVAVHRNEKTNMTCSQSVMTEVLVINKPKHAVQNSNESVFDYFVS